MKRAWFIFFAIMLLFSSAAHAASYDEDSYLGIWAQKNKMSITEYRIITIILEKSHKAYYSEEYYDDTETGDVTRFVCSWNVTGNKLTIVHDNEIVRELYRINKYQLSVDQAGIYNLYFTRVPNSEAEYDATTDAAAAADAAKEINRDPCGKWSFYFDTTGQPLQVRNTWSNKLNGYDLYIYPNGSAYLTEMHQGKDDKNPTFSYGALDGLWIGNEDDMTIRIGDQTYKAKVDENGNFLLYMTESLPVVFVRIDQTDAMIDQL